MRGALGDDQLMIVQRVLPMYRLPPFEGLAAKVSSLAVLTGVLGASEAVVAQRLRRVQPWLSPSPLSQFGTGNDELMAGSSSSMNPGFIRDGQG